MERKRYDKNDIKMLYEINKTIEIVLDTAIGNTESMKITEVVKQGWISGPTMCCQITAKVNDMGKNLIINVGRQKQVCQCMWIIFQQQEGKRR